MGIKIETLTYFTSGITPYRAVFFENLSKKIPVNVFCEIEKSKERTWITDYHESDNLKITIMKYWWRKKECAFCPEAIKHLKAAKGPIILGGYSTPTGMLSILWLWLHRKPFWLNADGGIIYPENKLKYYIKRFFISKASYWLSTGKKTTEYLVHYGAKKEKVFEYPFSSVSKVDVLDEPISREKKINIRNKLGMSEKHILLGVGQFIHRKGFDILLNTDIAKNKDIGIYLVGGKATDEYLSICKEKKLNNVHFIDFVQKNAIKEYYLAADLFVLPTREDIWGLVINEAMSNGVPVITTNNCLAGVEMIDDGISGRLVQVNNVEALSNSIANLIYDSQLLHKYSMNSLLKAQHYTIESMVEAHFLAVIQRQGIVNEGR